MVLTGGCGGVTEIAEHKRGRTGAHVRHIDGHTSREPVAAVVRHVRP